MTLQQTPEKRPKKIDLNLLPKEYLPVKKSKLSIILVLVTVLLICSTVPAIIAKSGVDSDIKPMRTELTALDATLKARIANNQEADAIQVQIDAVKKQQAEMQLTYNIFASTKPLWSAILTEIDDLTPASKITISSLSISDTGISISGIATKRQYVIDYATAFDESSFFKTKTADFSFGDSAEGAPVTFTLTALFDWESIWGLSSTSNSSK